MAVAETALRTAIAAVAHELRMLRDEYLPAFLAVPFHEAMPDHVPAFVRERSAATARRLGAWQAAITRLADFLPIDAHVAAPAAAQFDEFMFQKAKGNAAVANGGCRWRISLFIPVDWECAQFWPDSLPPHQSPAARERCFLRNLPRIKQRLMTRSVVDSELLNGLCVYLPLIADIDPAFVKRALDLQTWRILVNANTELTAEKRRESLQSIDHGLFHHVVNNALLHVFAALGNNHFAAIGDYLDHPCLHGSYTGLMPHYLFALLFQKVAILHALRDHDASAALTAALVLARPTVSTSSASCL
jgi:hypothetical protein